MKTNILVVFLVQILILQNIYSQKPFNAEITYIGTEGFMIKNNEKKLFVDALYTTGAGNVIVDESVESMILENEEPFSNSQLILVTHNHSDHFNNDKMKLFLTNNPSSKLVAPSGVITGIKDAALQKQLVSLNAAKYNSIDTTVNNIDLTVYNLMHDKLWGSDYNSGYLANLDGLTIFHGGDNVLDDTTEIIGYKLYEKNIDIAFLAKNSWKTEQRRELIRKYINPKYIILMHINPDSVNQIIERVKNSYPPIFVFSASMEKLKITDTITFGNRMPEKVIEVSDTTLKINTFFEYKLPDIFIDPDSNDSLWYSVTGLPTGLNFDSKKMNISGIPLKTGNFKVKVTAEDNSLCSNSISFTITIGDKISVNNTKQRDITVFPTIFNNEIYISNLKSKSTISVYSMKGNLIKILHTREPSIQIDLSNLKIGTYLLRVENKVSAYSTCIVKVNK
jgi:L-ascorbate metabolism protein UlaG (beta-lactamase superfamily)